MMSWYYADFDVPAATSDQPGMQDGTSFLPDTMFNASIFKRKEMRPLTNPRTVGELGGGLVRHCFSTEAYFLIHTLFKTL